MEEFFGLLCASGLPQVLIKQHHFLSCGHEYHVTPHQAHGALLAMPPGGESESYREAVDVLGEEPYLCHGAFGRCHL